MCDGSWHLFHKAIFRSVVFTGGEQAANFVVGAEEDDDQSLGGVLKYQAPVESGAAFEGVTAQFADAQAAVQVRAAKFLAQPTEGEPAFLLFGLRQRDGLCEDGRKDDEGFFQEVGRRPRGIFPASRRGGSARRGRRWRRQTCRAGPG